MMAAASDGQSKFDSVKQEMLGLRGTSKQEIKRKYKPRANRESFPPVSPDGSTDIEQDTKQFNSEDLERKPLTRLEDIRVAVSDSTDETTVKEELSEKENGTNVTRVKEYILDQTNGNSIPTSPNVLSGTSDETKVKELSSEQQNMIECTRINEQALDQANGNSTVYCFNSTERVVETIVISETSGGPHEMAIQPVNIKLEERVLVLEKDNRLLKERIDGFNRNENVPYFQRNQLQLAHTEHDKKINGLEQKFESLQLRVQKLENENQKLRQSMHFPATVDEWLGINIQNIEKRFLTDKLVTYFSKAFIPSHLGMIGEYFGFTDSEVCHIKHDTKDNTRESSRHLLKNWCNKKGETATIGALLLTLYNISQQEPSCIDVKSITEALKKANNSQIL
ncbi:uncharacterized protein LOC143049481 [Mytilus galloprovincialis]|uniref:uncharacterized protein LOC143049481 n=1 Tax=Mytilus galloprovincialis TaxID=29158 RepID=UPI003F7BDE06